MKLPVELGELMKMWAEDAPMNVTNPHLELTRIPILHAKYLRILSYHKLLNAKQENDLVALRNLKKAYYKGELNNPEDLKKYNLEPFQTRLSGLQVDQHVAADPEVARLAMIKNQNDQIVESATSILKELNNRTFQVRAIIDWEKFAGGR